MKALVETNVFSTVVDVPEDGDFANGAAFEAAYQALTNRTRNLHERARVLEGDRAALIYTRPVPLSRFASEQVLGSDNKWAINHPTSLPQGTILVVGQNGAARRVSAQFTLPAGSVLHGVRLGLTHTESVPTGARLTLVEEIIDLANGNPNVASSLATADAPTSAGTYLLQANPTTPRTVPASHLYTVMVQSSTGATGYTMVSKLAVVFAHSNPAAALVSL